MKKQHNLLGKYVDMCTDFGWKLYFGPGLGKANLINFLNSLFAGHVVIQDLEYRPTEHDGDHAEERRAIFDLYCTDVSGRHFIIEMQQLSQLFIKDRMVYYTSRAISKLLGKGYKGSTYELPEVYFIGILDFVPDGDNTDKYVYDIALCDKDSGEVFYDKLGYKLLVLPNFTKQASAITDLMDMWMYVFKHMSELNEMPKFLDNRVFSLIFEVGEVANLDPKEMRAYESSLKSKRDAEAIRVSQEIIARKKELMHLAELRESLEKGIEQGAKAKSYEVVENLLLDFGFDDEQAARASKTSVDFVRQVRAALAERKK